MGQLSKIRANPERKGSIHAKAEAACSLNRWFERGGCTELAYSGAQVLNTQWPQSSRRFCSAVPRKQMITAQEQTPAPQACLMSYIKWPVRCSQEAGKQDLRIIAFTHCSIRIFCSCQSETCCCLWTLGTSQKCSGTYPKDYLGGSLCLVRGAKPACPMPIDSGVNSVWHSGTYNNHRIKFRSGGQTQLLNVCCTPHMALLEFYGNGAWI